MKKLKVYTWNGTSPRGECRLLVAASSKAEAARGMGYARPSQMDGLRRTRDKQEIAVAMQASGCAYSARETGSALEWNMCSHTPT